MDATLSLFSLSSILMASLFAYSATVQLNDSDWYLWFPLYASACMINLVKGELANKKTRKITKITLLGGIFVFIKVVIEDFVHAKAGFWSLDMRERVVREKIGSGLVVASMFIHLKANASHVQYGMAALVGVAYGLCFVFFAFHKKVTLL